MRIRDIVVTAIFSSKMDDHASDSAQDDVIVEVFTDKGLIGIGEMDAPPTVVKEFIEMLSSRDISIGLKYLLIGEDPLQIERLWNKIYERTIMAGRRRLGINAIGIAASLHLCLIAPNCPYFEFQLKSSLHRS